MGIRRNASSYGSAISDEAVTVAGISQLSLPLEEIPTNIFKEMKHG